MEIELVGVDKSKGRVLRRLVIEGAGCGTGTAEEGALQKCFCSLDKGDVVVCGLVVEEA